MTITVDMIKSFIDREGYCMESYPCRHGPFEVELKDGRKVSANLGVNDIYSILKGLKDIGIDHTDWTHFSGYENIGEMGWKIRPADEILTEIFKKSVYSLGTKSTESILFKFKLLLSRSFVDKLAAKTGLSKFWHN